MTSFVGWIKFSGYRYGTAAMRLKSAAFSSVTGATLQKASFHKDYRVRVSAAKNPAQPVEVIAEIILSLPVDLKLLRSQARKNANIYNQEPCPHADDFLEQSYSGYFTRGTASHFRYETEAATKEKLLPGLIEREMNWALESNRLTLAKSIVESHPIPKRQLIIEKIRVSSPGLAERLE